MKVVRKTATAANTRPAPKKPAVKKVKITKETGKYNTL